MKKIFPAGIHTVEAEKEKGDFYELLDRIKQGKESSFSWNGGYMVYVYIYDGLAYRYTYDADYGVPYSIEW